MTRNGSVLAPVLRSEDLPYQLSPARAAASASSGPASGSGGCVGNLALSGPDRADRCRDYAIGQSEGTRAGVQHDSGDEAFTESVA